MNSKPKMTKATTQVLAFFLQQPDKEKAGTDVMDLTDLGSGTLYPILMRLERHGWLESRWEDIDPFEEGRPRKKFYKLTGIGLKSAKKLVTTKTHIQNGGRLAWV